ncbi:MAG: DNA polymerase III subunit delta [Magnetovibrio sp.]|nr:DNA polymerase III subunit delta [Magnetovibrio sp.]
MKFTGAKVEAFLRSPDPALRIVLFYGPDEGLVRERALQLSKYWVKDLADPFQTVELFAAALKGDPARLSDEAQSISFGGGKRLVRVRQANDSCMLALNTLFDAPLNPDSMVLVDAGDLNPRSKLRKLFETSKNAACIPCYGDDARTLPNVIRENLQNNGLSADRNTVSLLCQLLGSDRSVTRGELEKLALYMGTETVVTQDHVRAAIGDNAANDVEDVIYAAASGKFAELESSLAHVLADGNNPVQIVRASQRHFQRLHLARGHMATGMNLVDAVKALRPPVMFMRADAFKMQLNMWSAKNLNRAFDILTQRETQCKTTGFPAEAVIGRALLAIAQAARSGQPGQRR